MHILHLTPYYKPAFAFGGVVRVVDGLAQEFVRRGHQVTVLTTDALNPQERYNGAFDEVLDGIHIVRAHNRFQSLRTRFNLSSPENFRGIAQELLLDVDILHCHEFRTIENYLVASLASQAGIPIVLSPHGTLRYDTGRSNLKKLWDRFLSPSIAEHIDCVVGLTNDETKQAQALWSKFSKDTPPPPFEVIPNGIHLEDYSSPPILGEFQKKYHLQGCRVILFVGRLHERKGVHTLVKAFVQLQQPDVRLLIVGPDEGMLKQIQDIADERVIMTGYLDGDDRLAAFATADMFVLPAIGEGLSMAILEAMGSGLPVIVSPDCNMPEVEERGAGLIVEPSVEKIAGALTYLLGNLDELKQMGINAQRLIEQQYTWDAVASQYETLYERLMKSTSQ